jgi:aminocarboxymuconate-semialdehyde decarboxylase
MRIDVHAHYFPEVYLETFDRFGALDTDAGRNLRAGAGSEIDARLAMMDAAGVDTQVLSVGPYVPAFARERDAIATARLGNDLYAELAGAHPGRFRAFAALPLPHIDAALAELARTLDQLGMAGATITTSILGGSVADPRFAPVFEELDRRGAALFIHPAGVAACSPLVEANGLTWPIGAPIEDTMVALHLVAAGFPRRYPRLKIIIPHLGGAMPLLLPRLDDHRFLFLPAEAEAPSATVRRFWYDTVAHGSITALRCACEALGADRLVLGSDYPYQQDGGYTRAVTYVEDAGLTDAEVKQILETNAERLLA